MNNLRSESVALVLSSRKHRPNLSSFLQALKDTRGSVISRKRGHTGNEKYLPGKTSFMTNIPSSKMKSSFSLFSSNKVSNFFAIFAAPCGHKKLIDLLKKLYFYSNPNSFWAGKSRFSVSVNICTHIRTRQGLPIVTIIDQKFNNLVKQSFRHWWYEADNLLDLCQSGLGLKCHSF